MLPIFDLLVDILLALGTGKNENMSISFIILLDKPSLFLLFESSFKFKD